MLFCFVLCCCCAVGIGEKPHAIASLSWRQVRTAAEVASSTYIVVVVVGVVVGCCCCSLLLLLLLFRCCCRCCRCCCCTLPRRVLSKATPQAKIMEHKTNASLPRCATFQLHTIHNNTR
ncbi:unnamed protein product [Polarella glacialis]|uniref:Uncharacterized protein n=1 Tax=Polarella glacialis TaxID=89957 RepID=A0A813M5T0_POLGL|nr:unnamed protein product [Polarella glacialis]